MKVGVTLIVAVTGAVPLLIALNEPILPVPLAANPIEAVLFVQLYTTVPPVAVVEKFTALTGLPLHTTSFETAFTVAVGLTVIVNVLAVPTHVTPSLVKEGVTVTVAVIGAVVVFVVVKDAILPVPLAANPIAVFELVQLYSTVPPVAVVAKLIAPDAVALQYTLSVIEFTIIVGFTFMVKVLDTPVHVIPSLV